MIPGNLHEIMNDIAAADDQNSFGTQGKQLPAEIVVEAGRLGEIDAELEYGNIGRWKEVFENRPGAMVQSPYGIDPDFAGFGHPGGSAGLFRRPGRGINDFE